MLHDGVTHAEGAGRATSVHDKDEVVSEAKRLAGDRRPSQLPVHKKDGTVQTEQTYGQLAPARRAA